MPDPFSPFSQWLPAPPFSSTYTFAEAPSRELIWRVIELESDSRQGRRLFQGTAHRKSELWKEFRNYVRQARTYDDAALHVRGSSASLLYYYAALQLAKAELLLTNPKEVIGSAPHHGLAYSPASPATFASQVVTVRNGVFPMLYEKRTGTPIAPGTRIPIKRLLASIPEIGFEVEVAGLTRSAVCGVIHAAVTNGAETWTLLALTNPSVVQRGVTAAAFSKHYKEVTLPPHWRETFGYSSGRMLMPPTVFESRTRHTGTIIPQYALCAAEVESRLRGFLDVPTDANTDASLTPSLYRSKSLPMPPSMARYALMFYLSSLVRYRPSLLDRESKGKESWVFDAFTDQAPMNLLRSSLGGIKRIAYFFLPSGAMRR